MSRVGGLAIKLDKKVEIKRNEDILTVIGSLGEQSVRIPREIKVDIDVEEIRVSVGEETKTSKALWGTTRAHIANAVTGVVEGFSKDLEVIGVGYRASVKGEVLTLFLGHSHDINLVIPAGIKVDMKSERPPVISVRGISKEAVGQFAATIRSYRPPEPYQGKGVRYKGERVIRKEAKKKK